MSEPRFLKTQNGTTVIIIDYIQTIGPKCTIDREKLEEFGAMIRSLIKNFPKMQIYKHDKI